MQGVELADAHQIRQSLRLAFAGHEVIEPTGDSGRSSYYKIPLEHNRALSVIQAICAKRHIPHTYGSACHYVEGQIQIHPQVAGHPEFLKCITNSQVVDLIAELYVPGGSPETNIMGRTIAAIDPERARAVAFETHSVLPSGTTGGTTAGDANSQPGGKARQAPGQPRTPGG